MFNLRLQVRTSFQTNTEIKAALQSLSCRAAMTSFVGNWLVFVVLWRSLHAIPVFYMKNDLRFGSRQS